MEVMQELSVEELSALCSNLAKACTKQLRTEEADLFSQLSGYYKRQSKPVEGKQFKDLGALIQKDLDSGYAEATQVVTQENDRRALRALVWGEKVTKLLKSLLDRYEKQKDALLENTNVYVEEMNEQKTLDNLMAAFAGESQANRKYLVYAKNKLL